MDNWFDAGYTGDNQSNTESGNSAPDYFNFNSLAGMYSPEDVGFNGSFMLGNGDGYGQGQDYSPETARTNPDFQKYLQDKGLSFKGDIRGDSFLSGLFKGNQQIGQKQAQWGGDDGAFGALLALGSGALTGGAFGPGFAGGLSGALGGAAGGATGGLISSMGQGTDMTRGILGGAFGGGLNSLNPAGYLGVDNSIGKGAINGAFGGGVSAGIQGSNVGKGALMGGATGGLNGMGKMLPDFMSGIFGGVDSLDNLPGNMVSSGFESTASPDSYSDEGGKFDLGGSVGGYQAPLQQAQQSGQESPPQKTALSSLFNSAPSMGQVGSWAGNHAGDLASMAYGLYSQNKQKNQMAQMMQGLQGLYNPGGAYATQLRNKLMAKDAASGRRSNYAGRETQLMADLAGHNAQMMPGMMNMQASMNGNSNKQLDILMQGMSKLGGWKGLQGLFNPTASDGFNYNNLPGQ